MWDFISFVMMPFLKNILVTIVLLLCTCKVSCALMNDSARSFSIIGGTYIFGFHPVLNIQTNGETFFVSTYSPTENPAIGGKLNIPISKKKNVAISMLYSPATIGYHYSAPYSGYNNFTTTGHIHMHGIILNSSLQYRLFPWLKLNYGLGHYINLSNHFDNPGLAAALGWTLGGRNTMMPYNLSFSLGLELKVYKRLSMEINTMRGLTNFTWLHLSSVSYDMPMKMGFTGMTFNYRISK
jgi:hypothetical protein